MTKEEQLAALPEMIERAKASILAVRDVQEAINELDEKIHALCEKRDAIRNGRTQECDLLWKTIKELIGAA